MCHCENCKEIRKAIEQVKNNDTAGIWFEEGFAIVNKQKLMEVDSSDWSFDKSKVLKENVRLKNKLNKLKNLFEKI